MELGGPGRNAVSRTRSMLTITSSEFQKLLSLAANRESIFDSTQLSSQVGIWPSNFGPDNQKFLSSQLAALAGATGSASSDANASPSHCMRLAMKISPPIAPFGTL